MHELEFCGNVKSWCGALFAAHLATLNLAARRKNTKEHFQELCNRLWPDIKLTGRVGCGTGQS